MPGRDDIRLVGHVTRDLVELPESSTRTQPGGTALYGCLAGGRLGAAVSLLTKCAVKDADELTRELRMAGVEVAVLTSANTTTFRNVYTDGGRHKRHQELLAVGDAFQAYELNGDSRCWYFGPLTRSEVDPACIESVASKCEIVALDVQGLLRHARGHSVALGANPQMPAFLKNVHVLKASLEEALIATGERDWLEAARWFQSHGPREVLVTDGPTGSWIVVGSSAQHVPAFLPERNVDPTGCGDTYLAAYLVRRLVGDRPLDAALFASAAAGVKAGQHGALRATSDYVSRFARFAQTTDIIRPDPSL